MANIYEFTATQFIDYIINLENQLADAEKKARESIIKFIENEFKRLNPREYREYCLMIIRAFTPCK